MEENEINGEQCKICNLSLRFDVVRVGEKGLQRLYNSSEIRLDGLFSRSQNLSSIKLHKTCRKLYTNPKALDAAAKRIAAGEPPQMPSNFDFKSTCLFCCGDASPKFEEEEKKKSINLRNCVSKVQSELTKTNLVIRCTNRGDEWSSEVLQRIQKVNLVQEEARYHRRCLAVFFNPVRISGQKRGRPTSNEIDEYMSRVYNYLENHDDSQHTIEEIKTILQIDHIDDRTLIRKLNQKYGENIIIAKSREKQRVLCFTSKCHEVLLDSWYANRNKDKDIEKLRIIQAAGTIIRNEIRSQVYETSTYPAPNAFLDDVEKSVPKSLTVLMNSLTNEMEGQRCNLQKKIAVSHSIISLLRPKTFKSSLLLGLGSLLHHKYASRYLIDTLYSLGYCTSYKEVLRFETSAIVHPQPQHLPEFVQFSFDNADFNVRTLDALNTFHVMGGIQCNTPITENATQPIIRINKIPTADVIGHCNHVPLNRFDKKHNMSQLKNKTIQNYTCNDSILPTAADCLWLYAKAEEFPDISGWSDFMEKGTKHSDFLVSEIEYLPFINAPSTEYDTIYTALKMAVEKSRQAGMETCIVTFDQPLYQKAQEILHCATGDDLSHVILRLGGFHALMSFMGAIGYIMKESGLKELWNCIYALNSTDKMLAGHSYSRAVRAHVLTNAALFKIVTEKIELSIEEKIDIETAIHNIDNNDECQTITSFPQKINEALCKLRSNGPTAELWVQYFEMTTLVKKFIEAERSGNWNLHLESLKLMLPYFNSAGHFHYAKCVSMYLDDMHNLHKNMSVKEHRMFTNGFFTIRRTNQFWSGVWSDMTIEQTLMRSMKSTGGLTHGRGVSNSVLSKWILSLPVVQKVTEKIEEFCEVEAKTSEQHMDSTNSRIVRDKSDIIKLFEWFTTHDPFRHTENLVGLSKGIVGNSEVNCYKARDVGNAIMQAKVGSNYNDVKYSRKDRVLPLQHMATSVKVNSNERLSIDPESIMRRICFTKTSQEELKIYFNYELSPYPLSLFDECGMRKTKKSSFYDLFRPLDIIPESNNKKYVIDGGYLLHKVVWQRGMSYREISDRYVNYVKNNFGNGSVVFDGYEDNQNNTKYVERVRRTQTTASVEINFDENTVATVSQDKFLGNDKNKARLISMLKTRFDKAGIRTYQCDNDADTLIISTASQEAANYEVVFVVGEDVDLLVILSTCTHSHIYLMKPGRGKMPTRFYNSNSFIEASLKEYILFLHAVSGCDTTSALYRIGKKKCVAVLKRDIELKTLLKTFNDPKANPQNIAEAGEFFLCKLYGDSSKTLSTIRYERFAQATLKTSFNMASLPPTKDSATQHCYRVYHQVQTWLGNHKVATEWGWKIQEGILIPIQKMSEAAPAKILEMISCRCKTSCNRNCTCKKCGLNCTELCINCTGNECHGMSAYDNSTDSSDDEAENQFISQNFENQLSIKDSVENDNDALFEAESNVNQNDADFDSEPNGNLNDAHFNAEPNGNLSDALFDAETNGHLSDALFDAEPNGNLNDAHFNAEPNENLNDAHSDAESENTVIVIELWD